MKNILADQQNLTCPLCSKYLDIENSVIHHIDYDNLCHYTELTEWSDSNVIGGSSKKLKVSQCETCKDREPCLKRVVLVHKRCHFILHIKEGRISF